MRAKRWVVKVGSRSIAAGGSALIRRWMRQVMRLRQELGIEVVWLTSGAIATARALGTLAQVRTDFVGKQGLSAIGQPLLMTQYNRALAAHGGQGAQLLVALQDVARPSHKRAFTRVVDLLLGLGIVPIVNENDAVARHGDRFRDNDALAASLAIMLGADRLVLGTDVDGLFSSDPSRDPGAERIHRLDAVRAADLRRAPKPARSADTAGGMRSKLLAAQAATRNGVETWLIRADVPDALLLVAKDGAIGTRILPRRPRAKAPAGGRGHRR